MRLLPRLLALPINRPRAVLAIAGITTLALGAGVRQLSLDSTIESMLVKGDTDQVTFEKKTELFGTDERVSIAIPFGDALDAEALTIQARVADAISVLPGVDDVDALSTVDDIRGTGGELIVEKLTPTTTDTRALSSGNLRHIRSRVEANSIWRGSLISHDGSVAALQVKIAEDTSSDVVVAIEEAFAARFGGTQYYLAGHAFMKSQIARTMQRDFAVFLPVAIAVMVFVLAVSLRSLRLVVTVLLAVSLSVTWMLGAMGWLDIRVTALSNTAPTILIALATAYFMHLAVAYQRHAAAGGSRPEVVRLALSTVRRPTFVAGVTTCIGFGSLSLSSIPLIRGFGAALAIGIGFVILQACFVLPALLAMYSPRGRHTRLATTAFLERGLFGVGQFCARNTRTVLWGATLLFLGSAGVATQLNVDSSGPNAFPEDSSFRESSEFYQARMSGDVIENLYVSAREVDAFKTPVLLEALSAFQRDAEALPQVRKTVSIANYVAQMNRALHDDALAEERLPHTRAAVAQYLLLYSMSGDLDDFDELVDPSYRNARIVMYAAVRSSRDSAELRRQLVSLGNAHFPDQSIEVLSTEILLSQAADALVSEQALSFLMALVLILVLVAVSLGTTLGARVLLLPNLMPIAITLGGMALLEMPVNQSTAVIGVVALGIAVDGTVHLLDAAIRSRRIHGDGDAGIVLGLETAGRPIIITGAVVIAGFLVLMASDFRIVSELGGLIASTMALCLVADLILVPAQLFAIAGSGESGHRTALLVFGDSAHVAINLGSSAHDGTFRLIGAEARWRGTPTGDVSIHWLRESGVTTGKLAGYDDIAIPVLRVRWSQKEVAGGERED